MVKKNQNFSVVKHASMYCLTVENVYLTTIINNHFYSTSIQMSTHLLQACCHWMGPRNSLSLCFDAAGLAALRLGVFLGYLTKHKKTEKFISEDNQYILVHVLMY